MKGHSCSNLHRSPEAWRVIAKELSTHFGGILPYQGWLRTNGYNALAECMRKFPKVFADIPQMKHTHNLEDCVAVAQELAAKHFGILPTPNMLRKMGYGFLLNRIKKDKSRFRGILLGFDCSDTETWVSMAEMLAAENKGLLPCSTWLFMNGCRSLYAFMRNHVRSFHGIPRERRNNLGKLIAIQGGGRAGRRLCKILGVKHEPYFRRVATL